MYSFRPAKGSLSETRAFKATIAVSREMLELCDVINQCGEPLFTEEEVRKNPSLANDPRIVISFGNLFAVSSFIYILHTCVYSVFLLVHVLS